MTLWTRVRRTLTRWRRTRAFRQTDYLTAYRQQTDALVAEDPAEAIGGLWEELGQLQFDFLVREGVRPEHRMLDLGCGTLRGGRHFIRYLVAGHYTGLDLSPACIIEASTLVVREELTNKRPTLLVSDGTLTFQQLAGQRFDVVLAQSVFTHLLPEHITECFAHLPLILSPSGRFFFTYRPGPAFRQRESADGPKNFEYPLSFFKGLIHPAWRLDEYPAEVYPHPRGQRMVVLQRRPQRPSQPFRA